MSEFPPYLLLLCFVGGLFLLTKGADWFVDGLSAIALNFGMSKLIVGLTVVAIGTSAPEFAVSGYAAFKGSGDIALANVIGSNIFNIGFILAICAIASPIKVLPSMVYRDMPVLLLGAVIVSVLALQGGISRPYGIGLLVILAIYLGYLIRQITKERKVDAETIATINIAEEEINSEKLRNGPAMLRGFIGLVALLVGCNLVVESAKTVALSMGLSEWFIGITVIAVGTSLPELITAIASIRKNETDLGVGGLIGSDIFNIFGVLGMASIIRPIESHPDSAVPFYFFIFAVVLTLIFLRTGWKLTRKEGWTLLIISAIRYAFEIF